MLWYLYVIFVGWSINEKKKRKESKSIFVQN